MNFKHIMGVAGNAIKSINMGVGIVPNFSVYICHKREMLDTDRVYLQRLLREHERTRSGPVAVAQRITVQTILQLQELPDHDLSRVAVTMLPVLCVEFVAEPKDTTFDHDMSYLAQRIRGMNLKLETLSNCVRPAPVHLVVRGLQVWRAWPKGGTKPVAALQALPWAYCGVMPNDAAPVAILNDTSHR